MDRVRGRFRWIRRPQLLVSFIVVCLVVGAVGSGLPPVSHAALDLPPKKAGPSVKGAATPLPDCAAVPCIALTFDDGPHDQVTPRVLDILAMHGVKATFFVVGKEVSGREPLLRRMHREGHEIGNHSWSHADFTKLAPEGVELEIRQTQAAITGAGVPAPRLFRPPYGAVDPMVLSHTGLTVVRWNVDPEDWRSNNPGEIQQRFMQQARPGSIVLLHDIDLATADALEPALQTLKTQYQFVTVSQLLELAPGDQGQYFGR